MGKSCSFPIDSCKFAAEELMSNQDFKRPNFVSAFFQDGSF